MAKEGHLKPLYADRVDAGDRLSCKLIVPEPRELVLCRWTIQIALSSSRDLANQKLDAVLTGEDAWGVVSKQALARFLDLSNERELLDEVFLEAELEDEALLVEIVDVVETLEVMVISGDGRDEGGDEVVQHSPESSCGEGTLFQLLERLVPRHIYGMWLLDSALSYHVCTNVDEYKSFG